MFLHESALQTHLALVEAFSGFRFWIVCLAYQMKGHVKKDGGVVKVLELLRTHQNLEA
jgi:hypothetical protein